MRYRINVDLEIEDENFDEEKAVEFAQEQLDLLRRGSGICATVRTVHAMEEGS